MKIKLRHLCYEFHVLTISLKATKI